MSGERSRTRPPDRADAREDQVCFLRTVESFKRYHAHAHATLNSRRENFMKLSPAHLALIGGIEHVQQVFASQAEAIAANQAFLNEIIGVTDMLYESYWQNRPSPPVRDDEIVPSPLDIDKVYSTLRQFVRDWSKEGAVERQAVYRPVIHLVTRLYPQRRARILVPGAGLSRLSVELAALGFAVQGNEFSYHMLMAGHFAMNHCTAPDAHTIFPYCDTTINVFSRFDQFRQASVPDVSCYDFMDAAEEEGREFGELSMVAGDFVDVFSQEDQRGAWDCVVTCFFIDTAKNILEYLEILHRLIPPGGVWINIGPLLYHFSDQAEEMSIDLTYEELKAAINRVGFDLQEESTVSTSYTNNLQSMKQLIYHCPFFWCRRR
jgi:carnosine N-methyltransferase